MIAEVDVCRPRPVTALTTPTSRSASGTSALTSVDLPTPLWPISTLVRPASRSRTSLRSRAALGHHPGHAQRAVGHEQRLRVGQVGLGQAQQRLHARVERRHQGAVDQPRARLGVGQGGDHHELVGVRDDDALDRVVVVRGTPQHGRPLLHLDDPRQRAVVTGDVADHAHPVADDDALAAQRAGLDRPDDDAVDLRG